MIKNFTVIDGMQQFVQPLDASVTEPELIVNYIGDVIKGKVARTGYEVFLDNPDNQPVYAIVGIKIKDATYGDKVYFLRFSGKHVYKYVVGSLATSWGSAIYTFTNDPGGIRTVKYRNSLFIASANGSNPLFYAQHQSGVLTVIQETATAVPTNPTLLEVYANCLFANDSDKPYRLRRSAEGYGTAPTLGAEVVPFNGAQWTENTNDPATARSYDVNPDTNGLIAGLKLINNRLVIWLASDVGDMGMYKFDFQSLLQVPTSSSIRPDGQETITVAEDGSCYFANNDGVYVYDGSKPQRVSLALNELAKNITPVAAIDYQQRYMVALGNSLIASPRTNWPTTITNPVIVKDQVSDEWVLFDTAHRMICFSKIADSKTDPLYLYSGDANGNTYVWKPTDNTDAGETISGIIDFREFYGTSLTKQLNLSELYTLAESYIGQQVQIRTFEVQSWTKQFPLTGRVTKIPLSDTSHTYSIAVRVTNNSRGERPRYFGHIMVYEDEGATKENGG